MDHPNNDFGWTIGQNNFTGFEFAEDEKAALVAFMKTLTDEFTDRTGIASELETVVFRNRLDVDAKTSGGSVSTDFPVTVMGELKRSALKGKINAGGPQMYLRTSGGNIRLLKH